MTLTPPPVPQQPPAAPEPQWVRPVPTSGYAVASMILGIVGLPSAFCPLMFILPLVAVLLGHMALKETRGGHRGGHGMTVTGLILGYLGLIPAALGIAFGIVGGGFGG